MHFSWEKFIEIRVQGLLTPQFVRNIFYKERVVMLFDYVATTACEKIHPQFQKVAVFLFHDKENESSEQICEEARSPHSPAPFYYIRGTQMIPPHLY